MAKNKPKTRRKRPGPPKGRPLEEGANTRLQSLLTKKGLNQVTLARKIGATPSSISHAFRGRKGISLSRVEAIAKVLGVSLDKLAKALAPAS